MASYDRKDRLYRQAKEEGFRSRAAYKLRELDEKFRFLRPGAAVVDLGSFPGGWLQVAQQLVGPKGKVVGVDLRPLEPFSAQECAGKGIPVVLQGDLRSVEIQEEILRLTGRPADVVISDLSPQLTGIKFGDAARSAELVELGFDFAERVLRQGGTFVAKIFPGPESDQLGQRMRKRFANLTRHCLKSSRQTSNEFYFVGRGFHGAPASIPDRSSPC